MNIHNKIETVDGVSVQTGLVQDGVHSYSGPRLPTLLQLPPISPLFTGRHDEVAQLDGALTNGFGATPTIVMVSGPAGVGKTALAVKALSGKAACFPDGVLYADLAASSDVPLSDVLGRFLRALAIPPDTIPDAEAERVALWRSCSAPRRLAMLLESPASIDQVRPLLPASPHSFTLITGRHPLPELLAEGAVLIPVEPLDHDASNALLRQHLDAHNIVADGSTLLELSRLCSGLPLALTLIAAHAVRRPQLPLSNSVTALRDAHVRLEALTVATARSTRASLETTYRGLSKPAARAYRRLGLSPGPLVSVEFAAAAFDTDRDDAEQLLAELVAAGVLTTLDCQAFRFHDAVLEHARHTAGTHDSARVRAEVLRRIVQWYLLVTRTAAATTMPARRQLPWEGAVTSPPYVLPDGLDDYTTALGWLDRERRHIGAAVREALNHGWFELAMMLADALQPGVIIHKDYAGTAELDELILQAALTTGDLVAENSVRNRLARAYARLGDPDRARHHVHQLLHNAHRSSDEANRASALKSQALVELAAGHVEFAAMTFSEVVALQRTLGRSRAEGLALINLANILLDLGRPAEIVEHAERASTLLSTLDPPDRYNAARAELSLARARLTVGDVAAAERLAVAALATMTELESPSERARAYDLLADITELRGDLDRACGQRAIAGFLRSGRSDG